MNSRSKSKWPPPDKRVTTFGRLSRSELMSKVKSKGNETTELKLARLLRKEGLKGWRRHLLLPGKPDFTWTRKKVVVFVDGCFWHGHDCGKNITPKTNHEEWASKLKKNRARDQKNSRLLSEKGWTVIRIWECTLRREPLKALNRIRRALNDAG